MNRNFEAAFLSYVEQSSKIDQEEYIAKALACQQPLPEGPKVTLSKPRSVRTPNSVSSNMDTNHKPSSTSSVTKDATPKKDKPKLRSGDEKVPSYITRSAEKSGPVCQKSEKSISLKKMHKSASASNVNIKPGSKSKVDISSRGKSVKLKSLFSSHRRKQSKSSEKTSPEPLIMNRPKRTVAPKTYDNTLGLSWQEENELQKALYASLHNTRQPQRSQSEGDLQILVDTPSGAQSEVSQQSWSHKDTKPTQKEGSKSGLKLLMPTAKLLASCVNNGASSSDSTASSSTINNNNATKVGLSSVQLKAQLRAQRKFAQGSRPCSPSTTPVKSRPAHTAVRGPPSQQPDISNCKAKTEDFLTFLCLRGTNMLPPHLEHFNYPESEEMASFPNTPRQSQDGSCPTTPAHSSRPDTPAHTPSTAAEGGKNGRKPKYKRPSPDREILTDNKDLGVKPLVKTTTSAARRKVEPSRKHHSLLKVSITHPHHFPTLANPSAPNKTLYSVPKAPQSFVKAKKSHKSKAKAKKVKKKAKLCLKEKTIPEESVVSLPEEIVVSDSTVGEEPTTETLSVESEQLAPIDQGEIYMTTEVPAIEQPVQVPIVPEMTEDLGEMVQPIPPSSVYMTVDSGAGFTSMAYTESCTPGPYMITQAVPPDPMTTYVPSVSVMPQDTYYQLLPPQPQAMPAHTIVMASPMATQWLPVCYPYNVDATAAQSTCSINSMLPPESPANSPEKQTNTKHPSKSFKVGSKNYGSLTIRQLLPQSPHRSKIKGRKVVGRKIKTSASHSKTKGAPVENVEAKRKKKIFTSRVLRSGSSQLMETDIEEKSKATKPKSQTTKDSDMEEVEAGTSAVETIEKSAKRKSTCAQTTPSKKKKSGSETSENTTPKSLDRNMQSRPKKRKSESPSKSVTKAKAEIAEADSTTCASKVKRKLMEEPDDIIVIEDSPEPKKTKSKSETAKTPPSTPSPSKKHSKTPTPGKSCKKASAAAGSACKSKDVKNSGTPDRTQSTHGSSGHVPTLSLSFREFFPAPTDLPRIVQIPTYHPSAEEFSDPISYIELIKPDAVSYGICKIVPPQGWKPECKLSEELRFATQIQPIHRLMNRWGPNVQQVECIRKHLESQGNSMEHAPLVGGIELDMAALSNAITACGGLQQVIDRNKWGKVAEILRIPKSAQEIQTRLYELYCRYLLSYDTLSAEEKQSLQAQVLAERQRQRKKGGLDIDCMAKGRSRTLSEYFRASRSMQAMWFKDGIEPSPAQVENEYWRLVEEGKHHVCVQAGHLDTKTCGGAFPTRKDSPYSRHGWNFNMLQHNTGNILRHVGHVSGVTVSMLHIGMLFSSQCWSRDPHYLPIIHYLHSGADILWYCIPKSEASKLKSVMEELVPDLIDSDNPIWLPEDSVMLSPGLLIEKGLSLCRAVQENNQFMVIFPEAFTANISCGYNIAESIHFAPPDWVPAGYEAAKVLQDSCEADLFSIERLVLKLARSDKTTVEMLHIMLPLLISIVTHEKNLRRQLYEAGLKHQEKLTASSLEPAGKRRGHGSVGTVSGSVGEELYRCSVSQTICFLSMVLNESDGRVFSLQHAIKHIQKKKNLKTCKLLYRYKEKDLDEIISNVKNALTDEDSPGKHKGPKLKLASNS